MVTAQSAFRPESNGVSFTKQLYGARLFVLYCTALLFCVLAYPKSVIAQPTPVALDRARVIALARQQTPEVLVAQARVREAQASHTGTRILAQTNPELTILAGARYFPGVGQTTFIPDATISLAWPIDVSGTRNLRADLADQDTRVAQADADDAQRNAAAEALDLFVRALGADERVRLETARAALDTSLVGIAQSRRNAGVVGDEEIELAEIIRGQGLARLHGAKGDLEALLALLRGRLGIDPNEPVNLSGNLLPPDPLPLPRLLAGLTRRTDLARATAAIASARIDLRLQHRLGIPVPRAILQGSHDPEYNARVGFDLLLPVYQRNQTHTAIALARVATREVEFRTGLRRAEAELRATYAAYIATRSAFHALDATTHAATDAEQLATRSYQLGRSGLEHVVVIRREVAAAWLARLEALIALARARVAVDQAAGVLQ